MAESIKSDRMDATQRPEDLRKSSSQIGSIQYNLSRDRSVPWFVVRGYSVWVFERWLKFAPGDKWIIASNKLLSMTLTAVRKKRSFETYIVKFLARRKSGNAFFERIREERSYESTKHRFVKSFVKVEEINSTDGYIAEVRYMNRGGKKKFYNFKNRKIVYYDTMKYHSIHNHDVNSIDSSDSLNSTRVKRLKRS